MIKDTITELNKQFELYTQEYLKYDRALEAMEKTDDFDGRNLSIEHLTIKRDKLLDKREDVLKAIGAIQKVCDHPSWESAGNDSHYSYEKCRLCGHEEKC